MLALARRTFIISSGGGVHAYWLLREALPADALDEHEAVLKRLATVFCGDPLPAQAAAVMRLVGTHNSKRDGWRECVVLEENDRLYELGDLAEMLDGLPVQLVAAGAGTALIRRRKRRPTRSSISPPSSGWTSRASWPG